MWLLAAVPLAVLAALAFFGYGLWRAVCALVRELVTYEGVDQ